MLSNKFISSLVLSLAALQAVSASPIEAREEYPEVIPGPGLPSLESLGVTSAELYNMPLPAPATGDSDLAAFTGKCGPSDSAYTNVNGVIACFHYLQKLGKQACGVPDNYGISEFCRSGNAHATGQGITGNKESSYCSDVALGLLWVVDHCTRPDQSVAGFQAANGNGNLIVGGTVITW